MVIHMLCESRSLRTLSGQPVEVEILFYVVNIQDCQEISIDPEFYSLNLRAAPFKVNYWHDYSSLSIFVFNFIETFKSLKVQRLRETLANTATKIG